MRGAKISKRDLNILFAFFGGVLLLLAYTFICGHFRTLENTARTETTQLSPSLTQLRNHHLNIAHYEQEIAASKRDIVRLRMLHPDMVLPEEFIQFAVALEAETGTNVRSITAHDAQLLSNFYLPGADGTPVPHFAYRQAFTFTAVLSYDALKDTIEKIYAESERITLDECSVAYGAEDGLLNATLTISQVFINDGSYIYRPVDVPSGRIGTPNPFNTLD